MGAEQIGRRELRALRQLRGDKLVVAALVGSLFSTNAEAIERLRELEQSKAPPGGRKGSDLRELHSDVCDLAAQVRQLLERVNGA